jgi:hypothetical protein
MKRKHVVIVHGSRAIVFGGLVFTLHSTHMLEGALFVDAMYWFAHHVWEAFEIPHKIRSRRRA